MGVVLREVARQAGVSHNAPYRHFPERESLLAALAAEGFGLLGQEFEGKSGREMGEAYVRFALRHPNRFRLMFGGLLLADAYPDLRAAASRAYQALVTLFRNQANINQPEIAAAAAWALVHGLSHLVLEGHFAGARRDAGGTEQLVRQVLSAVRFASGPQRSA